LPRALRRQSGVATAAIVFAAFLLASHAGAAAALEETFEQVQKVGANATLTLNNADGLVYIYGSDANEIRITAVKKAYSRERLDGIKINVAIDGDAVVIDTVFPPAPSGLSLRDRSGTVDYTILVPQSCTLSRIELANGEIIIEGMHGATISAQLTNGRMLLRDCFSATRLALTNGGIDLFYTWWDTRAFSISVQMENGNLGVALPPDASLQLNAASLTGNVTNKLYEEKSQRADRKNLSAAIGTNPSVVFDLRTTSGNIRIQPAY